MNIFLVLLHNASFENWEMIQDNKFVTWMDVLFWCKKSNLKHFLFKKNSIHPSKFENPMQSEFYQKANIRALINLSSKMIEIPKSLKYVIAFKSILIKLLLFSKCTSCIQSHTKNSVFFFCFSIVPCLKPH